MRVDVESFLALVVLIGGAAAVSAAVVTRGDADEPATASAPEGDDAAPEAMPSDPVIPRVAKTKPIASTSTTEPVGTFTSTLLEPIPDEDPTTIPGPDVEGF